MLTNKNKIKIHTYQNYLPILPRVTEDITMILAKQKLSDVMPASCITLILPSQQSVNNALCIPKRF